MFRRELLPGGCSVCHDAEAESHLFFFFSEHDLIQFLSQLCNFGGIRFLFDLLDDLFPFVNGHRIPPSNRLCKVPISDAELLVCVKRHFENLRFGHRKKEESLWDFRPHGVLLRTLLDTLGEKAYS